MNIKILLSHILLVVLMGISFSCKSKQVNNNISVSKEPETVLSLQPSVDNPRNSEGDFIKLKNGKLLFVYTHYTTGTGSDHDPAFLASRYSADGGKSWSKKDEVVIPNEGDMNVMSVSLLRLQNGKIALFYLRKNSTMDCIPMMRISSDEARSWSEPIACIQDKKGYFVLNNDRVVQLADGRLMFAVAEHLNTEKGFSSHGNLFSYYSDDNGNTWTSSQMVPNNTETITQEPGLIEMADGRIMMFIRASGGVQQLSFSNDRGVTWSQIVPSAIVSPLSPASIEKIPDTKNWIMVWNNTSEKKRTPLSVAISKNEGKTWEHIKNLEEDLNGWYCYTAIYFSDPEHLVLGYCAGNRITGSGLESSSITRLHQQWLNFP